MIEELLKRFHNHDRQALSRLLTLVGRGEALQTIQAALPSNNPSVRVIAVTGNSGVGKSTFIGKSIEQLRNRGKSVAVLACDPQSALTGGALLGDRVRMLNQTDDPEVFVRSLAAASGQQAIAKHLDLMIHLLEAFGFDVVLLETVGAGQGDVAVGEVADTVVLLLQPGIGDELQWEKAGVLEIADVVVVHKADLPGAEQTQSQVYELLNLPGCREVPVLLASSKNNQGLEELWDTVEALPAHRRSPECR